MMNYENIEDEVKLKQLRQEKLKKIEQDQGDLEKIELRIMQIQYEKQNQLKMTI